MGLTIALMLFLTSMGPVDLATQGSMAATQAATPQQKPPVFRARVDLMQLDVSVLDRNGRPVRGLAAADFTLLEDGTPQSIDGFTAVDLPDTVIEGPAWASRTPADVATNEVDNQRIFVIMLDDALGMGSWGKREMKATATAFVEALGPNDLAAVVFTGTNSRASQNLTSDRARLIKAIQAYPDQDGNLPTTVTLPNAWSGGRGSRAPEGPCLGYREVMWLFKEMVKSLSSLPDRRKAILYFGSGLPWAQDPFVDTCGTYWLWRDVFVGAQQAHVSINPINTGGFTGRIPEHYLAVAENTGGHAVVNTNDLAPGVRQILVENSSYYLLAYTPANALEDGTFRRITVMVRDRPDVEVRTRRSYWAPKRTLADEEPKPSSPAIDALAGVLPLSDLTLRATAVPIAAGDASAAVMALAVGLRQPAFAERTPDQVELLVKAFTADGDERGTRTETIAITVPAARAASRVTRYEVLARIEVPRPGHYQLRLSAHSTAAGTRGGVYVDVDVPDFRKERLSLSGLVLDLALPAWPVAPARAFRDLMPATPTTERAFAASDIVTAFVRVYQGGKDALVAVPIAITIRDAAGQPVFERADALAADRFSADRSADYQLRLPLAQLKAGEYLLTVDAAAGKVTARRDTRFQVR